MFYNRKERYPRGGAVAIVFVVAAAISRVREIGKQYGTQWEEG